MTAGSFLGCWNSNNNTRARGFVDRLGWCFKVAPLILINEWASFVHEWTPFLLVTSYFVFSICLYMFCTEHLIDMFWFTYLNTNFFIAGSTFLEAITSLGPCRDARKAVRRAQQNDWTFPTPDNELLFLDLLIVSQYMYADI